MAKRGEQRGKLLMILEILRRETDEDHPISTPRLIERLAQRGIAAERKSVYADLDTLEGLGYDIHRASGAGGGVYLGQREFELAELKLLVDAVQAGRFITKKKSDILIKKLENLTSRHLGGQLQRQVYVGGRVKTMNESVYYLVDAIHTAIARRRQISFLYYDYNSKKERVPRRNGQTYFTQPYCLIWNDGNYYLVGKNPGESETRHFRVDKMGQVRVTDLSGEIPRDFDPARYARSYFSMFGGKNARVTLKCEEGLAGVILDRFGGEVMLVPGEGSFTVTVEVVVSPQFWGWLAGLGPGAGIVAPDWAAKEYRAYLQALLDGM